MKTLYLGQAEIMTNQAANAFLKSLEEPTPSTRLILATDRPSLLLPTIRSRCITLPCVRDHAVMRAEMLHAGVEEASMAPALALCGQHVGAAIALASNKDALAWAKTLHQWLLGKGKRPAMPPLGKEGLDARTCGLVFEAALCARVHAGVGDPTTVDTWLARNHDLDRTGLDIKTRLWAWYALFS
jgi:hypothetical protein